MACFSSAELIHNLQVKYRESFYVVSNDYLGDAWSIYGGFSLMIMFISLGLWKEETFLGEAPAATLGDTLLLIYMLFSEISFGFTALVLYLAKKSGPYCRKLHVVHWLGWLLKSVEEIVALCLVLILTLSFEGFDRVCLGMSWISFFSAFRIIRQLLYGYCDFGLIDLYLGILMEGVIVNQWGSKKVDLIVKFVLSMLIIYLRRLRRPSNL